MEYSVNPVGTTGVCLATSVVSDCLQPHGLVAHQAPLSMEFSRKEYTGVGRHSFLQGIFLTQGSNLHLLHCRQILYHLSYQGQLVATGKKKKNSLVPVSLLYPNKFQVGRNLNVKGEKWNHKVLNRSWMNIMNFE